MMPHATPITRRTFILGAAAFTAAAALTPRSLLAQERPPILRRIPSSNEELPVIGMGTWQTFDVADREEERSPLSEVLRVFFAGGGRLVDSSPMYGRAESVLGDLLAATGNQRRVFAATKVWTDGRENGIAQMNASMRRMRVAAMDLMQIHNLRDWSTHLPVLKEWKQQGRLRYIGITTSHGRLHDEFLRLMRTESLDFVQFTYNLEDRSAEERLLPLAAERGIATLINRPFEGGGLFARVRNVALPEWSADLGCRTWGQYFLKFIIGHPAVTCVIPATAKPHHMRDNMEAGVGPVPDAALRRRMREYVASL